MNILTIDIGTKTGWALCKRDGTVSGGTENFTPRGTEGADKPGLRWMRFRGFLNDIVKREGEIQVVYYEVVHAHTGTKAAHVYGAFEALLQLWAYANNVRIENATPGQIKSHWTGKGNADKELMIAAAKKRGIQPVDHNHCDALALLSYAREQEGQREVTPF